MRRALLVLAVGCLLGAACDETPTEPSNVTGDTWRLVSMQRGSGSPVTVPDPNRYTLRFGDQGRLEVKSDCNSCGGSYTLTGSTLDVGPVFCTKVFCGDTSLDSAFVAGLQGAALVTERGGELVVEGGGLALRFRK